MLDGDASFIGSLGLACRRITVEKEKRLTARGECERKRVNDSVPLALQPFKL